MLMTSDDAEQHDTYLSRYISTKEKKIIGKERIVNAKHKSGRLVPVLLSVTETLDENGYVNVCQFCVFLLTFLFVFVLEMLFCSLE